MCPGLKLQMLFAGALKKAAENARKDGKSVGCSIVETFGKNAAPQELSDVLRLEYRSKLLNPKWAKVSHNAVLQLCGIIRTCYLQLWLLLLCLCYCECSISFFSFTFIRCSYMHMLPRLHILPTLRTHTRRVPTV